MNLKESIQGRMSEFLSLCQKHKVKKLYAFGSSVTAAFKEESSDIDLLVELEQQDPIERGEMLISFWDKMEAFFHRKVDLLTFTSIKNPILQEQVDLTKVLVYDGKKQEIFI